ncbi:MAG: hypothetical protein LCH98_15265 [Actinobacteria bacterium]|nr:hypothetical protein [Actinomycetota bacterium]
MSLTRLDRGVKAIIARAYEAATDGPRTVIGEEHLLEAVAATPRGRVLLTPLTDVVVREEIWPEVARARAAGGLSVADREALGGVGIDVDQVMARAEVWGGTSGEAGAVRPSGGWGQRMSDPAAVALARAEDLAVEEGTRVVGIDHVVMGLVQVPSLLTEHLRSRGVTDEAVTARRRG